MGNGIQKILITWDIDPTPEVDIDDKKRALERLLSQLEQLRIPCTFFVHGRIASQLRDQLREVLANGHEIGCHGLNHDSNEEFDKLCYNHQQNLIETATSLIDEVTGIRPVSFRGPRVKTSWKTQDILEKLGYIADCSVCSQRLDFVSSNTINFGWIFAPRLPYHPSFLSPYRKGNRRLWVIPNSALFLPFISSALYTLGFKPMQIFFSLLQVEARFTGKPVVFLGHPFEFCDGWGNNPIDMPFLLALKTHGMRYRKRFYTQDNQTRWELTIRFLKYMQEYTNIEFLTVQDFVNGLEDM